MFADKEKTKKSFMLVKKDIGELRKAIELSKQREASIGDWLLYLNSKVNAIAKRQEEISAKLDRLLFQ